MDMNRQFIKEEIKMTKKCGGKCLPELKRTHKQACEKSPFASKIGTKCKTGLLTTQQNPSLPTEHRSVPLSKLFQVALFFLVPVPAQ